MGKFLNRIFNANNLAVLMLCLVILVTLASILLPARVPANLAPQLEATPVGTFVSITRDTFDAGAWRVDYPRGWRVVKSSVASDPVQVVFVSPDEALAITISQSPLPDARVHTVGDVNLYLHASATDGDDPATRQRLTSILSMMSASLRPG